MNRIIKAGFSEIPKWFDLIISYTPGIIGRLLRQTLFKIRVEKSGNNLNIGIGVEVTGGQNIQTGNNISIMKHSCLYAHNRAMIKMGSNISINSNSCIGAADGGQIFIGNNVIIAQNVVLRASDHEFAGIQIPIKEQGHTGGKIIIGDDCWIGANSVVTRNVTIGNHSIVGAGSVVTKDVEPFSMVAGVAAKLLRKRN